ncbi:MAG: 4-hydroxybenzoate octaprenyltransferase [Gemmatimonadales bacterium]|nr:4-hydroxybenzoate octaprenyltransferase [bacterium HR33]GIW52540.1 MAG: 4-hydroxybenzoate octaprenyltransferase [Gemmatimonadales bacterium]
MRNTQAWRPDLEPVVRSPEVKRGPREGQTLAGDSLWVRYFNFVKLPHTLFALPFALLGVVYASGVRALELRQLVLVVVAFTAARFAAMGFNRIVDRRIDALNPRTRDRELPAGRLSLRQASVAVAIGCLVFVLAAGMLNRLCLLLSPVALAWILLYSYTKWWTHWSHFWLGASLAIAPVGGYLAITGAWSDPWWALLAIAGAVTLWVAGFDILYALQDESFDRAQGLRSMVVWLGARGSILVARAVHLLTVLLLVLFGLGAGFGVWYYGGVVAAGLLLFWEHRLVRPGDLSRLDAAFFTMNGVLSVVVFLAALMDRIT